MLPQHSLEIVSVTTKTSLKLDLMLSSGDSAQVSAATQFNPSVEGEPDLRDGLLRSKTSKTLDLMPSSGDLVHMRTETQLNPVDGEPDRRDGLCKEENSQNVGPHA